MNQTRSNGIIDMSNTAPGPNPSEPRRRETGSPFDATSAFDVISTYLHPGRDNVMLIYVLYLAGLIPAFGVVPIIIGFVMALLNRSSSSGVWSSHYEFQYRQAVTGLIFLIISAILVLVVIGFAGLLLLAVWWIVRSIKGLQAASRYEPIPDPRSYGW